MNRFKIMIMSKNRFRLLLIATSVVAVTALSFGIGASYAEQNSPATPEKGASAAKPTPEEAAAAKRKADAATRALAKRAEMLKQRKAAREFIKNVVEGQQTWPAAPAPDGAGTGGAQ